MASIRLRFAAMIACSFLAFQPLCSGDTPAPFAFGNQFSVDMVAVGKDGTTIPVKTFFDNGRIRSEFTEHLVRLVFIIRPDQQKVYKLMPDQKIVAENRYYPDKLKMLTAACSTPEGVFEVVGSDTIDGVVCTKYKVRDTDSKISYWWINAVTKIPVKMASDEGVLTLLWKNYKAGRQDASLFEPPSGYKDFGIGMPLPKLPTGPNGK